MKPVLVSALTGRDLGPATPDHQAQADRHPDQWIRVNARTLELDPSGIRAFIDSGEPF